MVKNLVQYQHNVFVQTETDGSSVQMLYVTAGMVCIDMTYKEAAA